jgi:hypothetical protein
MWNNQLSTVNSKKLTGYVQLQGINYIIPDAKQPRLSSFKNKSREWQTKVQSPTSGPHCAVAGYTVIVRFRYRYSIVISKPNEKSKP